MALTMCSPMKSSSEAGKRPFSTWAPILLHKSRLKYSCLANDRNERESVNMPTKRLKRPIEERTSNWLDIPSILSENHHAAPNCILAGPYFESWKFPIMEATKALSTGLRL